MTDEIGDTLAQEIETEAKAFVDALITSFGTEQDTEIQITDQESATDPKKRTGEEYTITF